jgi:poly(A) polymerase
MKLELVELLQAVHPFVKGFDQLHYVIGEAELNAVTAGDVSEAVSKRSAQDIENVEGGKAIYSTTFYIGIQVEPKPGINGVQIRGLADHSHKLVLLGPDGWTFHTLQLNSQRW